MDEAGGSASSTIDLEDTDTRTAPGAGTALSEISEIQWGNSDDRESWPFVLDSPQQMSYVDLTSTVIPSEDGVRPDTSGARGTGSSDAWLSFSMNTDMHLGGDLLMSTDGSEHPPEATTSEDHTSYPVLTPPDPPLHLEEDPHPVEKKKQRERNRRPVPWQPIVGSQRTPRFYRYAPRLDDFTDEPTNFIQPSLVEALHDKQLEEAVSMGVNLLNEPDHSNNFFHRWIPASSSKQGSSDDLSGNITEGLNDKELEDAVSEGMRVLEEQDYVDNMVPSLSTPILHEESTPLTPEPEELMLPPQLPSLIQHTANMHVPSQHRFTDQELVPNGKYIPTRTPGIPPGAPLWADYAKEAEMHDQETIGNWDSTLDTLLVFAALFSAILTAFIIEVYKLLQPDPQALSLNALLSIESLLQGVLLNKTAPVPVAQLQSTVPASGYLWVNGLWFASLSCSLGTAMIILLVKQWLQSYSLKHWGGSVDQFAKVRQLRYNALQSWHVPAIISLLPLILQIAAVLFALGLIVMLHQINLAMAYTLTVLVACLLFTYSLSLVLPLIYPDCPYKSSASFILKLILSFGATYLKRIVQFLLGITNKFLSEHQGLPFLRNGGSSPLQPSPAVELHHVVQPLSNQSSSDLEEDSIIWLAKTSQNKQIINNSLESIQYLEHTSSLIAKLLDKDIVTQLVRNAYVPLPQREHLLWKQLSSSQLTELQIKTMANALPFMVSLMWVWKHPAYLADFPPPAISPEYMLSTHSWLLGDWILLWRMLCQNHQSNLKEISRLGWNLDIFIAIVCTEAIFYQVHVQPQTLPKLGRISQSFNLEEPNPIHDLYNMIEDIHEHGILVSETALGWLFSALKQILVTVDISYNQGFVQKTLILLLEFWHNNQLPSETAYDLISCIGLLVLETKQDKREFITRDAKSHSALMLQVFSSVIKNQIPKDVAGKHDIICFVATKVYALMCADSHQGYQYQKLLIDLPAPFATEVVQKITESKSQNWNNVVQVTWHTQFFMQWVSHGHISLERKLNILLSLKDLLASVYLWENRALTSVAGTIISFLCQPNDTLHKDAYLFTMCTIIKDAVESQNNYLLTQFLQLKGPEHVYEYLKAGTISAEIYDKWENLCWLLKSILANLTLPEKIQAFGSERHKLLSDLHRRLINAQQRPTNLSMTNGGYQLLSQTGSSDNQEVIKTHKRFVVVTTTSPDRKIKASGSSSGTVHIWGTASSKPLDVIYKYHKQSITTITFSPDGQYLASGSDDSSICVWNISTMQPLSYMTLPVTHTESISSLMFSPNSQGLVSASWDKSICLWNIDNNCISKNHMLSGHEAPVTAMDFSPDGGRFVSVSADTQICVWNVYTSGAPTLSMTHENPEFLRDIMFIDNNHTLTLSSDCIFYIWNIDTGVSTLKWKSMLGASPVVNPDTSWQVVQFNSNDIEMRNPTSPVINSAKNNVIAYSSNYLVLATTTPENNIICTWQQSLGNSRPVKQEKFEGHTKPIKALAFAPNDKFIASGSEDTTICIWSIQSRRLTLHIKTDHPICSLAYSQNGKCIASASPYGKVTFWNASTGQYSSYKKQLKIGFKVCSMSLSPDEYYIAVGSSFGTIEMWNTGVGKLVWGPWHCHESAISSISYSSDGKHLLSSSEDYVICIWSAHSGELLRKIRNL